METILRNTNFKIHLKCSELIFDRQWNYPFLKTLWFSIVPFVIHYHCSIILVKYHCGLINIKSEGLIWMIESSALLDDAEEKWICHVYPIQGYEMVFTILSYNIGYYT